jgi:hypothetical protein
MESLPRFQHGTWVFVFKVACLATIQVPRLIVARTAHYSLFAAFQAMEDARSDEDTPPLSRLGTMRFERSLTFNVTEVRKRLDLAPALF